MNAHHPSLRLYLTLAGLEPPRRHVYLAAMILIVSLKQVVTLTNHFVEMEVCFHPLRNPRVHEAVSLVHIWISRQN